MKTSPLETVREEDEGMGDTLKKTAAICAALFMGALALAALVVYGIVFAIKHWPF